MIWLIGIGGSLGAATRFILGELINRNSTKISPFPMGTWIINITGSFLLGFMAQFYLANEMSEWLWLFGGVGFCGAYTTFSTFGSEAITLIQTNKVNLAIIYVVTSVMVGILSAMIGLVI